LVNKGNAQINVTPYSLSYDGNSHTATGSATGVGGADLSAGLNLSGTTHTNAADYPSDTWTFSGGTNYNDASGTVHDVIANDSTSTAVSSSVNPSVFGQSVTFTATVSNTSGTGLTATGSVQFMIDGVNL